jgi:hypothetical protein
VAAREELRDQHASLVATRAGDEYSHDVLSRIAACCNDSGAAGLLTTPRFALPFLLEEGRGKWVSARAGRGSLRLSR